ncbi:M67 family metallopeptidase [Sphingobium sp. AN641]|uniref:M67 family metallopeptidase n=1 Tax=Sphingobium sp. AN641 TaxID=3133443 RepID=UPI0030BD5C5C
MTVHISRSLLDRIRGQAAAQPTEICGLLLGCGDRIDAILPAGNVAPDPARHFELDPAVLIGAHRAARQGGPAIVGHYHSHPSGVAVPSALDAASAAPDEGIWMIVAAQDVRIWRAGPGEGGVVFREARLVVD